MAPINPPKRPKSPKYIVVRIGEDVWVVAEREESAASYEWDDIAEYTKVCTCEDFGYALTTARAMNRKRRG